MKQHRAYNFKGHFSDISRKKMMFLLIIFLLTMSLSASSEQEWADGSPGLTLKSTTTARDWQTKVLHSCKNITFRIKKKFRTRKQLKVKKKIFAES